MVVTFAFVSSRSSNFFCFGADHLTLDGGGGGGGGEEVGDFWSSRIFFSSNLVGRIFFSHKLSITFVLRAIFFFSQALAGNFFSKSPTPPTQELNRPLSQAFNN